MHSSVVTAHRYGRNMLSYTLNIVMPSYNYHSHIIRVPSMHHHTAE